MNKTYSTSYRLLFLLLIAIAANTVGCNLITSRDISSVKTPSNGQQHTRGVTVFFNEAGSRNGNSSDLEADQALIDRINGAKSTIDCGVYGFSNKKILEALIAAHLRGVRVRVAGDAKHFAGNERGFRLMQQYHIPVQVGNEYHIMHDKLFIFDNYYVFAGTGNITQTGFYRNDNNWVLIEHPGVARRFEEEFEQMFSGKFTSAKDRQSPTKQNTWKIDDTTVEVYFSPEDDTMGRMLNEVSKADTNIYFTIFAFTQDNLGGLMVEKNDQFKQELTADELKRPVVSFDPAVPARSKVVTGVLDRSQVQGNGLPHEVYRMISMGVPMMIDANENSATPGDYQAGGGRLHSKTIILDRGTDHARVVTGSFNWSISATSANDEFLLILHGKEVAEQYYQAFSRLYRKAKPAAIATCNYYADAYKRDKREILCPDAVHKGDVVISEVYWPGWNGLKGKDGHDVGDDQFVELYNTTNYPIDLSLWTLNDSNDVLIGFIPGTVIQPHSYFYVTHHNIPDTTNNNGRIDSKTQVAFTNPDMVINLADDPRLGRFGISQWHFKLNLIAPTGITIDQAGDDGPPFAGEAKASAGSKSMERKFDAQGKPLDGTLAASWETATGHGKNINPLLPAHNSIFATPGEKSSNPTTNQP